jgi:putative acetyltransferase
MITIREEQSQDVAAIREVNIGTFGQPQEADIVDKLRENCDDLLSLVAEVQDQVVGHILFSPVTIDSGERALGGMGLAPMAVLPDYQRQSIGSELVRAGIASLAARQCPFVIVLGHPDYYPRFGFKPASRYGISSDWQVPDAAFMILILDRAKLQGISGVAKYRPEFAE